MDKAYRGLESSCLGRSCRSMFFLTASSLRRSCRSMVYPATSVYPAASVADVSRSAPAAPVADVSRSDLTLVSL